MSDTRLPPPRAFDKEDRSPDALFYAEPRLVTHIDDRAIAAVTRLYAETIPPGAAVLDLMGSWVSHLPPSLPTSRVVGHGMNADELRANPRLDCWFVRDLNAEPVLPLEDRSFDAACLCVSVQYVQRPAALFAEIARVLRPGAPLIVTFSNRCFPTKAVAIWRMLDGAGQQALVERYLAAGGFVAIEPRRPDTGGGDPIWAVLGRAPGIDEAAAIPISVATPGANP